MTASNIYEVGVFPNKDLALTFADYLESIKVFSKVNENLNGTYSLLVEDEASFYKARSEFVLFAQNPQNRKYTEASWQKGRKVKKDQEIKAFGFSFLSSDLLSFTTLIELICLICGLLMLVAQGEVITYLGLFDTRLITEHFNLWRLITPAFLHFSLMHIGFNLVMWEAFARPIERYLGSFKLIILFFIIALISNCLQFVFLPQGAIFGGMSGVVYGLIGYMYMLSLRKDLPSKLYLPRGLFTVSLVFIAVGFFMDGIANFCHIGGIIIGVLFGFVDSKQDLKKLLKRR